MSEQQHKASIPEKLALFFFFMVPLFLFLLRRRCQKLLQKHLHWTRKNINTLITINLVIVLALAITLLGLRIWLTHVRGW